MAFEVKIRNHKEEDVVVRVVEPMAFDWKVLSASHPGGRGGTRGGDSLALSFSSRARGGMSLLVQSFYAAGI